MHELYFDSLQAAQAALTSPEGRAAGRILQIITGGRVSLFLADYREDDLANIQKFKADSAAGTN
jgi:hypothetical protein